MRTSFLVLFFLCFYNGYVFAQSLWPDSSKHQDLNLVSTANNISVFTSQIAQVDENTLNLLKDAKRYFDQVFEMDFPIAILFVSNAEWNEYAYFPPPGMPQAWAGNIFLGSDKSVVAMEAEQQLKNLPVEQLKKLQQHFGAPIDMDLFYRNNVAVHELGHCYHHYEATKPQRRWIMEVFATYAARAYLVKHRPSLAAATAAYAGVGSQAHFPFVKHTALDQFEKLYLPGLGPQNYEWFQFQFFNKAVQLEREFGVTGLVNLRNFLTATDLTQTDLLNNRELQSVLQNYVGKDMAEVLLNWPF
jgi:hypothetical protein